MSTMYRPPRNGTARTHVLVEQGAEGITADTDVTNTPMAATFARARYPVA
ncbi:hypothetical protein ACH4OY_20295 [Micromonospora rubida]|uniref:Uncharacterized protein n=1 Tax=Micromonospora rubida TaxID=2697657 RepID=A0ABW7SMT9_9ACTN